MGARHRKQNDAVFRNIVLMICGILLIVNAVIWGMVVMSYGH